MHYVGPLSGYATIGGCPGLPVCVPVLVHGIWAPDARDIHQLLEGGPQ
jgi:hypothetical protein